MKTILITGASTGIGRSTAFKFQQEGWNVIATMRTPENETELSQLDNVLVTRLDVLDLDSIDASIKAGAVRFGKIDVVLNNAGYAVMGPFESAPRENVQRQFGVNVFGLMDVTRAALPHFRQNKSGLFINISSVGGRITFPAISLYHSTKWAVEGFSESLAYELEPIGIGVKIVEPGGVATDFGSRSLDTQVDPSQTEYLPMMDSIAKAWSAMTPEQMSTPELIADKIFEAATDGSSTLRYPVGADAIQLLGARSNMSDAEFAGLMKQNMGMSETEALS